MKTTSTKYKTTCEINLFSYRINQLIKEGKVKYYSSFKLFKNRKNEKNN